MPATATLLGGAMGLGVQLYSNAVRKLPLMRSACLIRKTSGDSSFESGTSHPLRVDSPSSAARGEN